jgi:hypothetical protein
MATNRELSITVVTVFIVVIALLAINSNRKKINALTEETHSLQGSESVSSLSLKETEYSSDGELEVRVPELYPDIEYTKRVDNRVLAYEQDGGPMVGVPMGIPVPAGTLKETSEKYDAPFYRALRPLESDDFFKPYDRRQRSPKIVVSDKPFYRRKTSSSPNLPFISSVNAFAPKREVDTKWEKMGIIQTVDPNDNTIMNIYRRPIAPLQDLYEYAVQDKDGFIVPLVGIAYLENGDIIKSVPGRESLGPWKVNIYVTNKYVWM